MDRLRELDEQIAKLPPQTSDQDRNVLLEERADLVAERRARDGRIRQAETDLRRQDRIRAHHH